MGGGRGHVRAYGPLLGGPVGLETQGHVRAEDPGPERGSNAQVQKSSQAHFLELVICEEIIHAL